MSFELLQQPMPDTASILTNSPFWQSFSNSSSVLTHEYPEYGVDIDSKIHTFLKNFNPTARLWDVHRELHFRLTRKFVPIVYSEQIDSLSEAVHFIETELTREFIRRDQIEYAYIRLGQVFQSMAHISPHLKYAKKNYSENNSLSLVSLKKSFSELISHNNLLALRIELLDDSVRKLETKKLRGLFYKMNYFLEYKRLQTNFQLLR